MSTDSENLVLRLQDGDQAAVSELYKTYGRSVWAVAYRVLGRRDLAEDATQQTFIQVWQHAQTLDPSREIGPWLHTVARRAAIDIARREKADRQTSLDEPEHETLAAPQVDLAVKTWEAWQIRQALDRLPEAERETVRLTHFEGLTHSEAAERLGVPIGTIKSRTTRAFRRLAAELGHLNDDP